MFKTLLLSLSLIAASSASAAAQERQWSLDIGDSEAFLVFGVPESDDVGISFWCALHSGEVSIFVPGAGPKLKPGRRASFSISAGSRTVRLKGKTTANEAAGTTSIEAKLADTNPLFAALRQADRFKVRIAGTETVYPLLEADLPGLLEACKKP
ncbi:MAG: hypothetical protein HY245_05550 [Rhizobiales bacterium]|nr:hypothetical protein [Hyphomicrobiales bacterium]MBI3672876.1 hypothetical protein [Hyphomicrobiales bacterium]